MAPQSPRSKAKLEYVHVANENVRAGQVGSNRVRSSQVKPSQVKSVYAGQLRGNCMSKHVSSKKEYLASHVICDRVLPLVASWVIQDQKHRTRSIAHSWRRCRTTHSWRRCSCDASGIPGASVRLGPHGSAPQRQRSAASLGSGPHDLRRPHLAGQGQGMEYQTDRAKSEQDTSHNVDSLSRSAF